MKRIVIGLVTAMIATSTTGCTALLGESIGAGDNGRILISADEKGMQAFGDTLSGMITNGKASPDAPTAHWDFRRHQETSRGLRYSTYNRKPAAK